MRVRLRAPSSFGVHSAMPLRTAYLLCPQAIFLEGHPARYAEESRRVHEVLQSFTPTVEMASIDEAYLDLTGTERLFSPETLSDTAWRIREEVLRRTRISVSLGGGTRRLIAKVATTRAKPAGVFVVPAGGEQAFLAELELVELPGVGPSFAEALKKRGLVRVRDALDVQPEWLERWFGPRRGAWLHRRIRGLDESAVDPARSQKTTVICRRSANAC